MGTKICNDCHTEVSESSKFCTNCGKEISTQDKSADAAQTHNINTGPQETKEDKPKSRILPLPIIGLLAAVVLILGLILIIFTRSPKIDLNDYITVNTEGYNTVGTAHAEINHDQLVEDHGEILREQYTELYPGATTDDAIYFFTNDYLSNYSIEPSSKLSNGDTISLSWDDVSYQNYDEYFDIDIEYESEEIEVEGLEEATTYDAFENINIETDGVDGSGTIEVINNANESSLSSLHYNVENNGNLSNGDIVEIEITSGVDSLIHEGILLEADSMEYRVDNLDEYLSDLEQINEDSLNELHSEIQDKLTAYEAQSYSDEWSLTNAEYIGAFLLTSKEQPDYYYSDANRLLLVYQLESSYTDEAGRNSETLEHYVPFSLNNVMVDDEGNVISDSSLNYAQQRGSNSIEVEKYNEFLDSNQTRHYSLFGFENLEKLEQQEVTSLVDEFNTQSSFNGKYDSKEDGENNQDENEKSDSGSDSE